MPFTSHTLFATLATTLQPLASSSLSDDINFTESLATALAAGVALSSGGAWRLVCGLIGIRVLAGCRMCVARDNPMRRQRTLVQCWLFSRIVALVALQCGSMLDLQKLMHVCHA